MEKVAKFVFLLLLLVVAIAKSISGNQTNPTSANKRSHPTDPFVKKCCGQYQALGQEEKKCLKTATTKGHNEEWLNESLNMLLDSVGLDGLETSRPNLSVIIVSGQESKEIDYPCGLEQSG